jgi:hypothetical protein
VISTTATTIDVGQAGGPPIHTARTNAVEFPGGGGGGVGPPKAFIRHEPVS